MLAIRDLAEDHLEPLAQELPDQLQHDVVDEDLPEREVGRLRPVRQSFDAEHRHVSRWGRGDRTSLAKLANLKISEISILKLI